MTNAYTGSTARTAILQAIMEYTENTCIRFVPKTYADDDYVYFFPGDG